MGVNLSTIIISKFKGHKIANFGVSVMNGEITLENYNRLMKSLDDERTSDSKLSFLFETPLI